MNFILFDDHSWNDLLPLTFSKPVAELRVGILRISEKWKLMLKKEVSYLTQHFLAAKFPLDTDKNNVWINGKVCPNATLINEIKNLKENQVLIQGKSILAVHTGNKKEFNPSESKREYVFIESKSLALCINFPWEIFLKNGQEIESDFQLLTKGKKSQALSKSNRVVGKGKIFIEKGAKAECSIFNTEAGPVYIGKNAIVMEGCLVRGPFALCEGAELKMGAKIYGPTTVGPYSKVGGEVNNSVIIAYSNKGHDGFLGNSVIGEWCNLGADTNNSNLKNNYGNVKMWNYTHQQMMDTGLQFCGLVMGDHSKSGINTMFNTGTVVGFNSNVFGSEFPIHFIPSFRWGGAEGFEDYKLEKALQVAQRVMIRRNIELTEADKQIFKHLYKLNKKSRITEDWS